MAAYTFETITAAQALAFDSNFDTLTFTAPGATASGIQVVYDTLGSTGDFAVTSQGRTVIFGAFFRSETGIHFPDGTAASIGGTIVAPEMAGGPENDALFVGPFGGNLNGGAGADTLVSSDQGGHGLLGGSGNDLFIIRHTPPPLPGLSGLVTDVEDWEPGDRISFGPIAATVANYAEIALGQTATLADATAAANALIGSGAADFVAVQAGVSVLLFADSNGDDGVADTVVRLSHGPSPMTLADIDFSQIVATPAPPAFPTIVSPPPPPPPPVLPPPPPPVAASGVTAVFSGNPDLTQVSNLLVNGQVSFSSTALSLQAGGSSETLSGFGFALDSDGNLVAGTLTGIDLHLAGGLSAHISGLSLPITGLEAMVEQGASSEQILGAIFAGNDSISQSSVTGFINGYNGDDTLASSDTGGDTLFGGFGNDSIVGSSQGFNVLIGGPGADTLSDSGNAVGNTFVFDNFESPFTAGQQGLDQILNWSGAHDFISFAGGPVATAGNYAEIVASSFGQAVLTAQSNFAQGIEYTVAQVGADLVVLDVRLGDAVVISNRTLDTISQANVGGVPGAAQPPPVAPPPPVSPPPPPSSAGVTNGTDAGEHFTVTASGSEVHAGGGNDTIVSTAQQDLLRGDDGNDSIQGGSGFDDINGNMGNDTISGGPGDDWVVGGKDDDLQFGDAGNDIVWGNLGNDTLSGGDGDDQVRGGQGDDSLSGGNGVDFISGDRGNDTVTGGGGADIFHSFSGAGIDRVLDFNQAEGDRVMLDPGTTFTLKQVGADTVVDMGNGDQMILVGVQLSTLRDGWIFGS